MTALNVHIYSVMLTALVVVRFYMLIFVQCMVGLPHKRVNECSYKVGVLNTLATKHVISLKGSALFFGLIILIIIFIFLVLTETPTH